MQPLNAYGLASEQLKDAIQSILIEDASLSQNWSVMRTAIRTQEHLLRSLRRFWNISVSQTPPDPRPISLRRMTLQLQQLHHENFPDVHFSPPASQEEFFVNSDPDRLFEMLFCITENAAIHAKSTVALNTAVCDNGVRIEISDDGDGIQPELIDALGTPFLRARSEHSARRKGLGLGLYIAARNAEILGLSISVCSQKGEGCQFSVELARATAAPTIQSIDSPAPIAGSHILIIDADAAHSQALQKLFRSWHCQARHAQEWSSEISSLLRDESFDALLISEEIWSQHASLIDQAILVGSAPPPKLVIIANGLPSLPPELSKDARSQEVQFLRRPLTPSRLRSAMTNVLRTRQ